MTSVLKMVIMDSSERLSSVLKKKAVMSLTKKISVLGNLCSGMNYIVTGYEFKDNNVCVHIYIYTHTYAYVYVYPSLYIYPYIYK
jgi:hypothetical protein